MCLFRSGSLGLLHFTPNRLGRLPFHVPSGWQLHTYIYRYRFFGVSHQALTVRNTEPLIPEPFLN
jgi:hypothetical protein